MSQLTARKVDPLAGFRFKVVIENYNPIGFKSVAGLKSTTGVIEYREGHEKPTNRKIPGLTSYDNINLKRGLDPDGTLQQIRDSVVLANGPNFGDGLPEPQYRFNGYIYVMDKSRRVIKQWQFVNGWAVVYGVDDLDAMGEDVAMEEMEIAHEGLFLVRG